MYPKSFNDVTGKCWCADEIGYMQLFGIIKGYEDGSFRLHFSIVGAEFASIACRFEKLTEGKRSFLDEIVIVLTVTMMSIRNRKREMFRSGRGGDFFANP